VARLTKQHESDDDALRSLNIRLLQSRDVDKQGDAVV
jgi:hypothetical protein